MKKISIITIASIFALTLANGAKAETILFEDFEDTVGFTTAGFAQYWGIAPLAGTASIPSNYLQGGNQSGNIFYGSFAKDFSNLDASPTLTIPLPDLSEYTDLALTVSIAAPYGPAVMWEITHRDKLLIDSNLGNIDTFRPISNASPLQSQTSQIDLGYTFQDFHYPLGNDIHSLVFTFASTDYPETVGIDSVKITGERRVADSDHDGILDSEDCAPHDADIRIQIGTQACELWTKGVPGKGILTAPGLQKLPRNNEKIE